MGKRMANGFNPDKYEHIQITNKRKVIQTSYNIHWQTLSETSKAKYLGVTLDNTLSWNNPYTELYPGQNFWGPPLTPSNIFRGPFWIFEGHELMEENTTKNELTTKFCFEHCKAQSFTLKIKTFSFCVKEQLKMSISLSNRTSSFFREEIVSTSMTQMFWK